MTGLLLAAVLAHAAEAPALSDRQKVIHVLDRLTFGARPGDVERVEKMGVEAYIDAQLRPEKLDDAACEGAVSKFKTLTMTSGRLADAYPDKKKFLKRMLGGDFTPPRTIVDELAQAKLTRAVMSERQLQEVMTDFWFNHFNVYGLKNQDKWLITSYERDVIRPRALGKFRDLLGAVAHSPAMLVYLDNAQSTVDKRYAPIGERMEMEEMEGEMARNARGKKNARTRLGLNENYARELMELHTLGVDGGYTQKDVTELARVLTGWSIERPNKKNGLKDFAFKFHPRMHDRGGKVVLGTPFMDAGELEGDKALDLLAKHPSTAHFIALKLCRRFVSDDPPPALVDFVAERWRTSGGDIRETLKALFNSPEFYDPKFFRAKVKTPFEFMASSLRATDATLDDPLKLTRQLERMGEPLYLCEPPTGYPDRAQAWISAGALLARLQFAQQLFNPNPNLPAHARDVPTMPAEGAERLVENLLDSYLGGQVSARTREAIVKRLDDPEISGAKLDDPKKRYRVPRVAALVLGSPDFQRR